MIIGFSAQLTLFDILLLIVTMGSKSNLQKTPKFSFLRAMIRSDSWPEINRSKQIIPFQMDYGRLLEVKHI